MHRHSTPAKLASLLLASSSILLSADAFPPNSSFRSISRSTSLSRASIPLSSFEAIDTFTSIVSATSDSGGEEGEEKSNFYIRPYLKPLLLLCRPINFPIVFLFHVLGVHRAVEFWKMAMHSAASSSSSSMLFSLLKEPSMIMVLLSLMLVTSTSMITNDYYDARNGVDVVPEDADKDSEYGHYHPLAEGTIPFSITKKFDSFLYAILLLSSAFVPGTISRLFVIGGAITTYLYTVHLKPKIWIKNISCAALVAMSPITSGLAAWQVLRDGTAAATAATASSSVLPSALIFQSPLTYLVISLFAGIMSRETLMDITDFEGDARAGIETVPVKYGKEMASRVAMGWSIVSAVAACGESLVKWVPMGISRLMCMSSGANITTSLPIMTSPAARKLVLSVMGSGLFARKTYAVWKTKGDDVVLAEKAVRDGLLGVLLVLASFM